MAFTLFGFENFGQGILQGALSPDLSKKYSYQTTNSSQDTYSSVYAPVTNRSYDIQYNYASGGSTITTKKEQSTNQSPVVSPNITPQIITIPTTSQSGSGFAEPSSSSGSESPFSEIVGSTTGIIIIGLIVGGVYLYASKGRK